MLLSTLTSAALQILFGQQYDNIGRRLIAEYCRRNDGRMPYIPSLLLDLWLPKHPVTREDKVHYEFSVDRLTRWLRERSGLIEVRRNKNVRSLTAAG